MLVQVEKYSPDRVLGAVDVSVTLSISTFSIEKALVFLFFPPLYHFSLSSNYV